MMIIVVDLFLLEKNHNFAMTSQHSAKIEWSKTQAFENEFPAWIVIMNFMHSIFEMWP